MVPITDTQVESDKNVTVSIATSDAYTLGTPNAAALTIEGDDDSGTDVWAETSNSTVTLYWDSNDNATYKIYRGITADFTPSESSLVATSAIGIVEDTVSCSGATLYYKIFADKSGSPSIEIGTLTLVNGVDNQFDIPDLDAAIARQKPEFNTPASASTTADTHRIDWIMTALANAGIDPSKWAARYGYSNSGGRLNKDYSRDVYEYYQQLNQRNRGLYWAGMARLAGGPVTRGLQDASAASLVASFISLAVAKNFTAQAAAQWAASKANYVQSILIYMQQCVFFDMAWQNEAYLGGGMDEIYALHDAGQLSDQLTTAWQNVDLGIHDSEYASEAGGTALLYLEQSTALKLGYDTLHHISSVAGVMSHLVENPYKDPVTDGQPFDSSTGLFTEFTPRWDWISSQMLDPWYKLPNSVRNNWIDEPYANLIAGF